MSETTNKLQETIKSIAELQKKKGKSIADAMSEARSQNAKWLENLDICLPEQEWRAIVQEVYGNVRKLFLSTGVMGKIEKEVITWAVENVLLKGSLNLFIGDPDVGKTLVAIFYIARLSRQGKKTVVICREDSYSHVWVPRLSAVGADLDLIIPVFGLKAEGETDLIPWMLDSPEHIALLKELLLKEQPELCLIDPIADFAGSKDLNKAQDCRAITGLLNATAQDTNVAMLANCHTTKAIADSVIKTAAGSFQLIAAVAIAWFFMQDPDKEGRRLMLQARNKYGTKRGHRYSISDASSTDNTGVVRFLGAEYRTADGMLKQMRDFDDRTVRKWLTGLLESGEKDAEYCNKEAGTRGYDRNMVTKACEQLRVDRSGGKWRMAPKEPAQQEDISFDVAQLEVGDGTTDTGTTR